MSPKLFITTILSAVAASFLFSAWTLANPPSGSPGQTYGILQASTTPKYIGINIAPATTLDVNGTTTIRQGLIVSGLSSFAKNLDMGSNLILNLNAPSTGTGATNKTYVDSLTGIDPVSTTTVSRVRVWSEGRNNLEVVTSTNADVNCGGTSECFRNEDGSTDNGLPTGTPTCTSGDIKVARSKIGTPWSSSAAACPRGWWVCTKSNRDVNSTSSGWGVCGSGSKTYIRCDYDDTGLGGGGYVNGGFMLLKYTDAAWTAEYDRLNFDGTSATSVDIPNCDVMPAWCCKYQ